MKDTNKKIYTIVGNNRALKLAKKKECEPKSINVNTTAWNIIVH